ncbi:SDR family NAD(P)-dependent oxidoreductase [Kitasatospora sp. NPDC091207]|uniref:SDR family NAD(P)-dependent oxidoreductase n=1 Tax=Kitasatospora sp. NPDC091207 TaxID=3364083 RepID=UPI0037FDA81D
MTENRPEQTAGTEVLRTLAGRRVATTVRPEDEAVRNHLVHSVPVLPGVFLLDLVLRLVRHTGVDPAGVELRRILFLAPVVGQGAGRRVEVVLGEAVGEAGWLSVTVRSRPADAPDDPWQTNCRAELHPADEPHAADERSPRAGRPIADLVADAGGAARQVVDIDELYGFVRALDIVHRGFMKASGTVEVVPGHALARMRLAPEAEPYLGHFHAHPAVLDFATLVPMLLFDRDRLEAAGAAFIPIFIDSFHVAGPLGAENLVHVPGPVRGGLDAELFEADLRICSPDGRVVASLTGFRAKRIRSADLITRLLAGPAVPERPEPAPIAGAALPVADGKEGPDGQDGAGGGLYSLVAALAAGPLGRPETEIDPDAGFYELGLSSIDLLAIAGKLEERLATQLYPTLLFEYPTVRALAEHLDSRGLAAAGSPEPPAPEPAVPTAPPAPVSRSAADDEPLAIVGLAGHYPGASDLDAFWEVLSSGRDGVTEIPADRWDHAPYWTAQRGVPGRSYAKWGAFLDGVAEFDAPFFHLTARQADLMDPHERLFLQTAWEAVEDAGHSPESLGRQTDGAVGVFAGAMWNDYQLTGLDRLRDGAPEVAGSWASSLANRVSYAFDFQGPSLTVDTACAASSTALHLAAESIRRGECRAAVVGGVNLSLHPYKYLRLAELGLLSATGRCRPFGRDADGYVPGEGVGAVVLRPLGDALASGDHVYGLLLGSALRHSGRTGGFSVPSPEAQAKVVSAALADAGVPAATIGYLEAQAGSTTLGDQIEIEALTAVYGPAGTGACALGSVKSGIGHLEAAAGIAGLTKILLCLRHGTIPGIGDIGELNPGIRLDGTPFRLPRSTEPWPAPVDPQHGTPLPRRAALSTFGAGGTNVHLVVQEYEAAQAQRPAAGAERVVPLTARTEEQLRRQARRLARHLRDHPERHLDDVAHTLQNGRRPMEHRLAVVVHGTDELVALLEDFAAGGPAQTVHRGRVLGRGPAGPAPEGLSADELARRWTAGGPISWPPIPGARRVPLPTYPFERTRHWVGGSATATGGTGPDTRLYAPRWQPQPPAGATDRYARAVVLALDTDEQRVADLRARCGRLIQVRPGVSFARVAEDCYEISPTDDTQHRELARELRERGMEPEAVLHLWALRPGGADPVADTGGLLSVFSLGRAWLLGRREPLPVLHAYLAPDREHPAQAAVGGLARSIRLEQPALALTTVRFTALPSAEVLLAEAAASVGGPTEVRHTAEGRSALAFAPLAAAPGGPATPPARDGGVYLISGGAGGLGRHTAGLLAERADVSVALLGRSPAGPASEAAVAELEGLGARALYLSADVTDHAAVERAVATVEQRLGPLTGVIHCAGRVDDGLLVTKSGTTIAGVLAPKLYGAVHLDAATRSCSLDYFLLYSSVASVLGNEGATDYGAANRHLDSFAAWRESLRRAGERNGRTIAVNWPLWRDGGMRIAPAAEGPVLARTGARPLETAEGLAALEAAFRLDESQVVVLHGDLPRLEERLGVVPGPEQRRGVAGGDGGEVGAPDRGLPPADGPDLAERALDLLTPLLRSALGTPEADTAHLHGAGFMALGLSSTGVVDLVDRLARTLGVELRPTVLFRHPDARSLAAHLAAEYPWAVSAAPDLSVSPVPAPSAVPAVTATGREGGEQPIAVIGMAGRFPGSDTVDGLWADLLAGRDLVTPVPADRWDHGLHHDPEGLRPGGTDCGHGAFLRDVARFDARFFGVHRAEAEGMDPQARLLLEVLHEAAEAAGVAPELRGSRTGTFVGRCFNDYEDEMLARGLAPRAHDVTGTSVAMAANRPSYVFDLTGPSLTVDTACSSSLHALHLAVNALRRGECDMAFAAGANLILSPQHYLRSSALGALSPSGRCHSFDARADGYVPGEAVVAVLLKPLDRARADGDPVHAVIRSVAVNHGGRAGSATAPNPARQTELLLRAWEEAGIDPRSIGLLEAHGTGTALGDPIEVEGAVEAFRRHTDAVGFCALGTAKAHLGHTEGAAGLVGVVKAVQSLRHRLLPAMPDFRTPNPHLGLDGGPLYINTEPVRWEGALQTPRRAAVSSFGFGGAYAHAVLEEAPEAETPPQVRGPLFFPFSASDPDRLRALVRRHRHFLAARPELRPDRVAATLCHGRAPMAARFAVVAESLPELVGRLDAFLRGDSRPGTVVGDSEPGEAARRWVEGGQALPASPPVRTPRLSMPTHPFEGERYWFDDVPWSVAGADGPSPDPAPVAADDPAPVPAVAAAADDTGHVVESTIRFVAGSGFSGQRLSAGMDRLDELLRRWCSALLAPEGRTTTAAELRSGLADQERFGRLVDALAPLISRAARPGTAPAAPQFTAEAAALAADHPELAPWLDLVAVCMPRLPEMLAGIVDPLEVYFAGDNPDLLLRIYDGNPVADHHNEIAARLVAAQVAAVRRRRPDGPVRILEIGGGTGGTTRRLLEVLAEHGPGVDYTFSDVSPAFFPAARARFGQAPAFVTKVLDLDIEPEQQGFTPGCADVVVAANSVHATRCMADSLARIRRLLAPGGVLVLEELVRNRDCMTAMIGALPGYWAATDQEVRLPHSPFLDVPGWRAALAAQGFERTWALGAPDLAETEFDNAVLFSRVPTTVVTPVEVGATEAAEPEHVAPAVVPGPPADRSGSEQGVPAAVADAAEVGELLRPVFARFFGLPVDDVDVHSPFDAYGMDSLSAIQLARTLEPTFGRLPKVLLYEHPTIAALAAHLAEHAPVPSTRSVAATTVQAGPAAEVEPAPHDSAVTSVRVREDDPVAIVGMAGRFAESPDLRTWWHNLRDGVDLVTEIPADRFDWQEVFGDPHRARGTVNSRWGSFIDGVDRFDAEFFGMTPLEAELMDPQQRLMLQTAWHAVEDSGHSPAELRGSRTGVFIGATSRDYDWQLHRAGRHREAHVVSGNGHCLIANRISYQLDLRGPSEAVDTACSSSLTALHRAVRSVRSGECEAAIAGGVHLFLTADLFVALGQLGVLSPDGRCAAFDRRANGMVRGEAVVAVLLKPLSRALADGDTVYALVRGSGVSHGGGGHMDSLMMPNPNAQADLIASVHREAGVAPETIGYVEAHGTGTEIGDPIELRGLRKAFAASAGRPESEPVEPWCGIGSVKSNVGHTEAAAGLTGVVKTVLAMRYGLLPPTLHFTEPNPLLDLDGSPFRVVDRLTPWPSGAGPRRAGVSAFGLGGTNAHVLLEEYRAPRPSVPGPTGPEVVPLSARTPERLRDQVRLLHDFLAAGEEDRAVPLDFAALAHTLREGRDAMGHRLAVVAHDLAEVRLLLRGHLAGEADERVVTGRVGRPRPAGPDGDLPVPEDPYEAARGWVGGGPRWRRPTDGPPPRRVPLPAYPFEARRHWADVVPPSPDEPSPGASTPGQPDVPELLRALQEGRVSVDQAEQLLEGVL